MFLDPGSTGGLENLRRSDGALLRETTVICTDDFGLTALTGVSDAGAAAQHLLRSGVEILVHTGQLGEARILTASFECERRQTRNFIRGSTLGIGDAFKGWLLGAMVKQGLARGQPVSPAAGEAVLRTALAAAAARKADERIPPAPVSRQEIDAHLPFVR